MHVQVKVKDKESWDTTKEITVNIIVGTKPLQTSTSFSFTIFLCVCVLQLSVEALFIEKDEDEGRKKKTPSFKNSKITILLLCHRAHFYNNYL